MGRQSPVYLVQFAHLDLIGSLTVRHSHEINRVPLAFRIGEKKFWHKSVRAASLRSTCLKGNTVEPLNPAMSEPARAYAADKLIAKMRAQITQGRTLSADPREEAREAYLRAADAVFQGRDKRKNNVGEVLVKVTPMMGAPLVTVVQLVEDIFVELCRT